VIGQLLDKRYRILQVLGAGAFGKTYLAADLRRPGYPQCVVKQLRLLRPNPTAVKNAHRLFQREAEMLQKLGSHPQIPRLLAYFEQEKQFYLVKEFTPGHPLSKEMPAGEKLPEERVASIITEILEVLVFVHGHQVIHRDIKPANLIRRSSDGKLVLIDFGSVKEIVQQEEGVAAARTIAAGTPSYMPIEQFYGTPRLNSDIYAVGTIAIQALAGLSSEELQKLRGTSKDGGMGKLEWQHLVSVSHELAAILDRMVHHDYTLRYQTAEEVLVDLYELLDVPLEGTILAGTDAASNVAERKAIAARPWYQHRRVQAGGALVALAIAVGGLWQVGLPQRLIAKHYFDRAAQVVVPEAIAATGSPLPPGTLNSKSRRLLPNRFEGDRRVGPNFAQAVADYSQALKWRDHGRTYFHRGVAYYVQGDWNRALADFNQALRRGQQGAELQFYLGSTRHRLGDRQSARLSYGAALDKNPRLATAYWGRGRLSLEEGNYGEAIADFDRAIEIQKNWAAVHRDRAQAQYALGDFDAAIADATAALTLDAKDSGAYQIRGQARFRKQDLPGALADLNAAIGLAPNAPDPYYHRAIVRSALNELQGTLDDLNEAIRRDGSYALAYLQRGALQEGLGNPTAATDDFRQAAKLCLEQGRRTCYGQAQERLARLDSPPEEP
jgi:tetratricopeptide (TPR) repeat protein